MTDLEKLVDQLSELTVLEAADLTKLLEEKWGVSAAAPVAAVAAVAAGGASDAAPAEEKSEWNVVIQDHGAKKIDVIKAIRQVSSLGLKDAKEVAETAGSVILEAVAKEAAEDAKKKLEEAGATVELQ
ncbi:MAG: 50S ribosomal protein L7/L12 [Chloroflexota bacterium]|jgi:large subunit ribosomal protein L7/L12|nr:50S ribosomal protein L7/L12 [Anaerolineaceae bacterium]MDP6770030.1 50S ribosomal protein L7/L12 [Anaerolineales bacterium]MEE3254433.1 50S ribosomal protein L7/L12 [Chloroflexota bacterium]HJO91678.1 50S ribosomal protein L7/L12 [Anaerolineales bacterium]|tara:strand:+ start:583 stop:966 length:384 start_codon:yes stop_codon:yes gene_type:complete